ncbi:hypothetical protein RYH73_06305 [Olivibacter sp. CPCC 100613]|uniref:hypothetical protein n=1 Tax=Olivibacter sp. CPCC 100613 TaxID=3079931 RepID=UPI002FF69380
MHRGEFLDVIVRRNNVNKTKLAEKAGYDRTTYYYHIKQPDLDFAILNAYGKHIPYDFSINFPEMLSEFPLGNAPINTFEGMKKDRDFWKEEYTKQYQENKTLKEELEKLRKTDK